MRFAYDEFQNSKKLLSRLIVLSISYLHVLLTVGVQFNPVTRTGNGN